MQDIRSEIEERLADASKRRADLMNQIKAIDIDVETLKKMMEIETQRHGNRGSGIRRRAHLSPGPISMSAESVADLIEKILEAGPRSKDVLKEIGIEKGIFDPDTAGRTIHITLVNMMRGNRIEVLPDGRYGLPGDRSPQRSDPPGAT